MKQKISKQTSFSMAVTGAYQPFSPLRDEFRFNAESRWEDQTAFIDAPMFSPAGSMLSRVDDPDNTLYLLQTVALLDGRA